MSMNDNDFEEFLTSDEEVGCKSFKHKIHFKTLFQKLKEGLHNFGVIPDVISVTNRSANNASIKADSGGSKFNHDEDNLTNSSTDISIISPAVKKSKFSKASSFLEPITIKCQPLPIVFKTLNAEHEEFEVKILNREVHKYICWMENSFCEFKNVPLIKNVKGEQSLVLFVNSETL